MGVLLAAAEAIALNNVVLALLAVVEVCAQSQLDCPGRAAGIPTASRHELTKADLIRRTHGTVSGERGQVRQKLFSFSERQSMTKSEPTLL
ncbi:hypothetical protein IWX48DRAFT_620281 [Phyllosticta citricarpa]